MSDRFDVTATASLPALPTPEDRRAMMRALLADRLVVDHIERPTEN